MGEKSGTPLFIVNLPKVVCKSLENEILLDPVFLTYNLTPVIYFYKKRI